MPARPRGDGGHTLFVKGGPVEPLARCATELRDGEPQALDDGRRAELMERTNAMTDRGLRVLAFAYREVADRGRLADADEAEGDPGFLGILGLADPPRPGGPGGGSAWSRRGHRGVLPRGRSGPHRVGRGAQGRDRR